MKKFFAFALFLLLLPLMPVPSHAVEKKAAPQPAAEKKAVKVAKKETREAVVLMPLRPTKDIPQDEMTQYEAALVKSLSEKYVVYSGQRVVEKVQEVYRKRSAEAKESEHCDETKCYQDLAIEFQTELVAIANIRKTGSGYSISLTINNVMDDKAIFSEQKSCKGCDESAVADLLKTIAGGAAPAAQSGVVGFAVSSAPSVGGEAKVERVTPKVSGGAGMKVAMLIVDSIPTGADVYLGDLMVGTTLYQNPSLQPDQLVRVTLKKDMYHDKVLELTLKPGVNDVPAVTLAPAFGSVFIESDPAGAEVYIGGKKMGETPYKSATVKSGKLLVGLKKALYAPVDNEVVVVEDGKETRKKYTLAVSFGELQVESDPSGSAVDVLNAKGASVAKGQTPYGVKLEPGKYSVHVTKAGHTGQTFNVELATGKKAVIGKQEASLRHLEGVVIVTSTPLDRSAKVYVDGQETGTVPATLTLAEGTHEITVKTAKQEGKESVSVKDGESQTVSLKLKDSSPAVGANSFAPTKEGMEFVKQGDGGFYMDKTEVTQEAYQKAVVRNPSYFKGCPTCPVEQVTWDEADAYCKKVGKRLPTEQEWEYSATSGGKEEIYAGTSNESELGNYAWYDKNAGGKTHPVGGKRPNGLGLYDMSGNVWEWTDSWYDDSKRYRVLRGGSWSGFPSYLRASNRGGLTPDGRSSDDGAGGFRCAQ